MEENTGLKEETAQSEPLETHPCSLYVCMCLCKAADRRLPSCERGWQHPAGPGPGAPPCHPSGTRFLFSVTRWVQMRMTCRPVQLTHVVIVDPMRGRATARLRSLSGHLPPVGSQATWGLSQFLAPHPVHRWEPQCPYLGTFKSRSLNPCKIPRSRSPRNV